MDRFIDFLKNEITEKSTVEDIVNIFEQMCRRPLDDDMILFETGTYSFSGKPLFYFSLVRQFPNDEEEYYQIHVDILYKPTSENQIFSEATWDEEVEGSIFDYIKKSEAFVFAKNQEYIKVDIYLDET